MLGLQTQAETVNPCDSLTYWTDQGQGLLVGINTSSVIYIPDSMDIYWQVCDESTCYGGSGVTAFFGQITTSDTIKVCYDITLYTPNMLQVCTHCDSLIYDGFSWIPFTTNGITSVVDIRRDYINNNKIYDLLGRELKHVPTDIMYIRNNKLYISK